MHIPGAECVEGERGKLVLYSCQRCPRCCNFALQRCFASKTMIRLLLYCPSMSIHTSMYFKNCPTVHNNVPRPNERLPRFILSFCNNPRLRSYSSLLPHVCRRLRPISWPHWRLSGPELRSRCLHRHQ
ncbi:unnamed protein product, partial [Ectocarpus sp. 12 AP-2014]